VGSVNEVLNVATFTEKLHIHIIWEKWWYPCVLSEAPEWANKGCWTLRAHSWCWR